MKTLLRLALPVITLALFVTSPHAARALTLEELVGTYQGTTTLTLEDGRTLTYNFTTKYKANGAAKTTAFINGQKIVGRGTLAFVTDRIFAGVADGGTSTGFIEKVGQTLRATVVTRSDADGSIIVGRSEATRVP